MIQLIKHRDLDFFAWDRCLESSMNKRIYAYSWYLNSVCDRWDALVEGDYNSIMPLPIRKKWGISYVFPPVMTQQLGIFSTNEITEKKVKEFIKAIPQQIKYGEIKFNSDNGRLSKNIMALAHNNYELNLNFSHDELIKNYSANNLRNIKKVAVNDLKFLQSNNLKPLINAFKQGRGTKIAALPDDFFSGLQKLFDNLLLMNKGVIYEVHHGDKYCGGGLIAKDSDRIYFLFSAINEEGKLYGLMHKLIDHIIKLHAGSELIFDFEGSDNANLARFYSGFGASLTHYYEMKIDKLPKLLTNIAKVFYKK